jgi:hypothetical protein
MADEADRAQALEEQALELALARHGLRPPPLPDRGRCHACGAETPPGRRWCDADCRDDWQRLKGSEADAGPARR